MRDGHVDAVSRKFVAGWAADADRPETALVLSIWVDGVRLGQTKANRLRTDLARQDRWGDGHHGFRFKFAEPLSAEQAHSIAVRFADGTLLPPGEQMVEADSEPAGGTSAVLPVTAMSPVLVSGPAHSGTGLVLEILAHSPDIVVAGPAPYTLGLLAYYAGIFRSLTAPDAVYGSQAPGAATLAWRDASALTAYANGFLPATLGGAMARLVGEYYRLLAADAGKPGARFLAEQNTPVDRTTRQFVRRVFPTMRDIVMLRDPRDMLADHIAADPDTMDAAFAALTLATRQWRTLHREARPDTLMLRYEDLRAGGDGGLGVFLGASIGRPPPEAGTTSVGQWRVALAPGLAARCTESWGDFLQTFGYGVA